MRIVSKEEIEAARTKNGGWTKEQLNIWGIPWPPVRGWRKALETGIWPKQSRKKLRFENVKKDEGQDKFQSFYNSWEWKRLRYDFLKKHNRQCSCCGNSPQNGTRVVVDHVKPIRKYWELRLDINNLQILCDDCNMGKGSRDYTDWR